MPIKLQPYRSYRFIDKDPVIDKVRTVLKDSGLSYQEVHVKSGVSVSCINNWFSGGTRRPQFATVNAVGRACGSELIFVPMKNLSKRGK